MASKSTSKIQTIRYNFVGGLQGRDSTTTKDQRFVNMFPEKVEGRTLLVKRPGLSQHFATERAVGRGIFHFNNKVWSVIGNKVYMDTVAVLTLTTTTGYIGFTECTEANLARMFFCDGVKGYIINLSNVITEITDADFPSPHIPTPVYIDGYVCLPRAASADIYNCDLENPFSWTASNFITSELFPDQVTSLARQNNHVVAFGETGTEFFYDNGANQATGTPLARNTSAFLQMGTCAPYAIGQNERYCFFISQSQSGGRAVWKLDGFSPEKISDEAIGRILDYEEQNITNATGYLVRLVGHFFFVICLTNRALVYDVDEKLWHEWNSTVDVTLTDTQLNGSQINYKAINSNDLSSQTPVNSISAFQWTFATDIGDGTIYLLHRSTGVVATFDRRVYLDIDQFIRCEINTPLLDFGSYKRKLTHRLNLVGDLAQNSIFLRWSDNDYQTWSSYHIISMETRPVLHRLGSSRRRAYNLYYSDNYPLRIEGIEFIIEEGET